MTTSLHERLEAEVAAGEADGERVVVVLLADLREAAAALRPPEGELGALCEQLEAVAVYMYGHPGTAWWTNTANDLRAAIAHLRRLAMERNALRQALETIRTHRPLATVGTTEDGATYTRFPDVPAQMRAIARRALAPSPAAEPGQ